MSAVQASEVIRVGEDVGATCYCCIAFSSPKISARRLHCRKARGTSRVHTDAWPRETEEIAKSFSKEYRNAIDRKY